MGIILGKIKKEFFAFLCGLILKCYSMGNISGKIKKNFFFLLFSMYLYYKVIEWVVFWGKLKKKIFLLFSMDL
jgi:hypothetical protein